MYVLWVRLVCVCVWCGVVWVRVERVHASLLDAVASLMLKLATARVGGADFTVSSKWNMLAHATSVDCDCGAKPFGNATVYVVGISCLVQSTLLHSTVISTQHNAAHSYFLVVQTEFNELRLKCNSQT